MESALVRFTAIIKKFGAQGEKTGWRYIELPAGLAQQLHPGCRQAFRVKGRLDALSIRAMSLIPMGDGHFILALKADIRKALRKQEGATLEVELEWDGEGVSVPAELMECLADEPECLDFYNSLSQSQRNYFSNWINSAKTEPTRTSRIAQTLNALSQKMNYPEWIRSQKSLRETGR